MEIQVGDKTLKLTMRKRGRAFSSGKAKQGPACWKIETVPNIKDNPNQANYYGRLFPSKFYQKGAFQYMFGGLLRAIFGVFSPYKFWDREQEILLKEDLSSDYFTTKRKHTYGIYTFKVSRSVHTLGVHWPHGQRPPKFTANWLKRGSPKKTGWTIPKNQHVYVRVNTLDYSLPVIDIEFYAKRTRSNEVISVSKDDFNRIMKVGKLVRRADFGGGRIYAFFNSLKGSKL